VDYSEFRFCREAGRKDTEEGNQARAVQMGIS